MRRLAPITLGVTVATVAASGAAGTALGPAFAAAVAHAAEVPCGMTEPGVIVVDGLLDDWQGVAFVRAGGGAGSDAGIAVRCNYDQKTLYVALDVADDRVVRLKSKGKAKAKAKAKAAGEDRLVLTFGGARLEVLPAHAEYGVPRRTAWTGSGGSKAVKVADSFQPRGFSVELALPLTRVPGWTKGVALVPFTAELHDADMLSENRIQEVVSLDGQLSFAEGADLFKQFLSDQRLKQKDLRLDVQANMDGAAGNERVVAGGRVVGVLGEGYSYLTLPVQQPKDILDLKVVDLGGKGRSSLIVRYVERGGGGSRQVLAVFNHNPDGSFARVLAQEVHKQLGTSRLVNSWSLVPAATLARKAGPAAKGKAGPAAKGKVGARGKKPRGMALVVRAAEAVGFTAETWRESPAEDMRPILLPWAEPKETIYTFEGDEVVVSEQ